MTTLWLVWLMFSAESIFFSLPRRILSGPQNIARSVRTAGGLQRVNLADSEVGNSSCHTKRLQTHGTVPQIPSTWLLISNQINL